jgi:hypothetical protein
MPKSKISNTNLKEYRRFLECSGCKMIGTKGGHEKWTRSDLNRPIMLQTHIDPVPEHIVAANNRTLGLSTKQFLEYWNQFEENKWKIKDLQRPIDIDAANRKHTSKKPKTNKREGN